MTGPRPQRPWGSEDDIDRDYYDPDSHRHCVPETPCSHLADADWRRTLAALDGDAGVAVWQRRDLGDDAYDGDWDWPDFDAELPSLADLDRAAARWERRDAAKD